MGRRAEPDTPAYVDTSAFVAFLDQSDTYHEFFVHRFAAPPRLLTSSLVIAEGHAWFLRRYDRFKAFQFLAFIDDLSVVLVAGVGSREIQEASKYLRRFSDQDLTLTDATGLFLMKRDRIKSCWSTDFHLGLTGVPLVTGSRS
jgi:predicted nucleic acid-binding protein